ncbi:hypothetical protein PQC65_gp068 [Aeromonas phage pAEv1810]|nr:hypothetical protein PQC65_gp068 [Aeromonas phage pAEv1810]UIS25006.1 hypothetical protein pAEv1810_68 [Aeromonas phage pAEv1810]
MFSSLLNCNRGEKIKKETKGKDQPNLQLRRLGWN